MLADDVGSQTIIRLYEREKCWTQRTHGERSPDDLLRPGRSVPGPHIQGRDPTRGVMALEIDATATDPPSCITVDRSRSEIAVVTLNRPDRLNALTEDLVDQFLSVLEDLDADDIRAVVLTGSGTGFCAGLDVIDNADVVDLGGPGAVQKGMRAARSFSRILPAMRRFPKPVIAAVNGPAVGGGFVLALGADLRVMARSAYFADGFVGVGLSGCELGLGFLLPRLIGSSRRNRAGPHRAAPGCRRGRRDRTRASDRRRRCGGVSV